MTFSRYSGNGNSSPSINTFSPSPPGEFGFGFLPAVGAGFFGVAAGFVSGAGVGFTTGAFFLGATSGGLGCVAIAGLGGTGTGSPATCGGGEAIAILKV